MMVDEISNKTLAVLLIVAIALSLGGTLVSLNRLSSVVRGGQGVTGYATGTGYTNVSITTTSAIQFAVSILDFGTGSVNISAADNGCTMASNTSLGIREGGSDCVGFNAAGTLKSLVIENYGNNNLTVTLASTENASTMFGGPSFAEKFLFKVENNETGACANALRPTVWSNINRTAPMGICSDLLYTSTSNSILVHINVTIPRDAYGIYVGNERQADLTAEGTAI